MQAVFRIAAAGIHNAFDRFAASAERTARDPLDAIADENVARLRSVTELTANLQVLETADAMTEALLDIRA